LGGRTAHFCGSDRSVDGITGRYFEDNRVTQPSELALDDMVAEHLRAVSGRLVRFERGPRPDSSWTSARRDRLVERLADVAFIWSELRTEVPAVTTQAKFNHLRPKRRVRQIHSPNGDSRWVADEHTRAAVPGGSSPLMGATVVAR
jgi:hypothetical protein